MSWQRVYLPQGDALPSAEVLSSQVRSLKGIQASLSVADPTTQSMITVKRTNDTTVGLPEGMRVVYLVTNEVVRSQRLADEKAAVKKEAAPPAPVDHAVAGMRTAADELGGMTADQQRQAIPLMMQQMMRMFQSIDPSVRAEMADQWRQRRSQGGGAAGQ